MSDYRTIEFTLEEGKFVDIGGEVGNCLGSIKIERIQGESRVRVAFDFPKKIDIHRKEVADEILGRASENAEIYEAVQRSLASVTGESFSQREEYRK